MQYREKKSQILETDNYFPNQSFLKIQLFSPYIQ